MNLNEAPMPFVVGTGRCGSTLLRVMLDAHPLLAIPPETHFIPPAARAWEQVPDPAARFLEVLSGSRKWHSFVVDTDSLRKRVDAIEPFDLGEAFRAFYRLYAERFNKPRWGDKTPGYLVHMQLIERVLPEARFVHLIRDGRDVTLSVLPLMDRSGRRHTLEEGAEWWVKRVTRARKQSSKVSHYLEVRYEDLVLEPESVLRRVCDFVELPWDPKMIRYYEGAHARLQRDNDNPTAAHHHAAWRDAAVPPKTDRVARWRTDMTTAERERVESIAGPLLHELGYA